jgi:hypothetical protein
VAASLLNTLLGLWLVYAAVLDPAALHNRAWPLAASAAALLVLGFWAYRADYLKWPGISDVVVGLLLLVLLLSRAFGTSDVLVFWVVFWSGCIAGVVSLWSVFYRSGPPSEASETSAAQPQ